MPPSLRKFALTAHVTASVGWIGAVAGFLVLAVAGYAGSDLATVRATVISMELLGWFVIVPLAIASSVTGLVQAMGTTWGLWRHYWVVIKLFITIPATALMLIHMQPISAVARLAADGVLFPGDHRDVRLQFIIQAAAALAALLVAVVLSVYKRRASQRTAGAVKSSGRPRSPRRQRLAVALTSGGRSVHPMIGRSSGRA